MPGFYRGSRDPNLDPHAYNMDLTYCAKFSAPHDLYMEIVLKGVSLGDKTWVSVWRAVSKMVSSSQS